VIGTGKVSAYWVIHFIGTDFPKVTLESVHQSTFGLAHIWQATGGAWNAVQLDYCFCMRCYANVSDFVLIDSCGLFLNCGPH
jgi:hypothetical protein